jgi:hypothetical protein
MIKQKIFPKINPPQLLKRKAILVIFLYLQNQLTKETTGVRSSIVRNIYLDER